MSRKTRDMGTPEVLSFPKTWVTRRKLGGQLRDEPPSLTICDNQVLSDRQMNHAVQQKLERLRSDYREVAGKPFSHFFCPMLFRDEDVGICRAHIVNATFPGSCRNWTVQRADVDSFYGYAFESDFVDIQY